MTVLSINDPDVWKNIPEHMKHVQEGRGEGHVAYLPMGDYKDNPPTAVILHMGPGWVLPRHAHDCHRLEVVLSGTLDIGDRILKPGDIMMTPPNVPYGPHVAGPEGSVTLEMFTDFKSSHTPLMDLPEGLVPFDTSTVEGRQAMLKSQERQKAAVK